MLAGMKESEYLAMDADAQSSHDRTLWQDPTTAASANDGRDSASDPPRQWGQGMTAAVESSGKLAAHQESQILQVSRAEKAELVENTRQMSEQVNHLEGRCNQYEDIISDLQTQLTAARSQSG